MFSDFFFGHSGLAEKKAGELVNWQATNTPSGDSLEWRDKSHTLDTLDVTPSWKHRWLAWRNATPKFNSVAIW